MSTKKPAAKPASTAKPHVRTGYFRQMKAADGTLRAVWVAPALVAAKT